MTASGETNSKIKVAIVGGGCAALTTAFELTRARHNGRYEVTVYQTGWRLGGKGASGRGDADRIEEHGLHLWMGFYENAFRLMRECYAERHRAFPDCRHADWRQAFEPAPDVAVADRAGNGWEYWLAHFPPGNGEPGDPNHTLPLDVSDYIERTGLLLAELLRSVVDEETGSSAKYPAQSNYNRPAGPLDPAALMASIDRLFVYGQLATSSAIIEASNLVQEIVARWLPGMLQAGGALPLRIFEALSATARARLDQVVARDSHVRRTWEVIDLVLAVANATVVKRVLNDDVAPGARNHRVILTAAFCTCPPPSVRPCLALVPTFAVDTGAISFLAEISCANVEALKAL